MSIKVAVLYGGLSAERKVSLSSGQAVYEALQLKPFNTELIDMDSNLAARLNAFQPDVAVIALHGKYGEDGCVQGLLEIMNIPYTGPGVLASSLAMNKIATKKIFCYEGIPTPDFVSVKGRPEDAETLAGEILQKFQAPMVIKAATQGSSIGIQFAFKDEDVLSAVKECLKFDNEILAEKYISGRELTVSVLGNQNPIALPTLEIVTSKGFYDYEAKYTAGASEHFVVNLPAETDRAIKELAVKSYTAIGCEGLSRVDFMLCENGELFVLEVNTSPGMTATSLFPDAARAVGIEFPDLIEKLINLAMEKHQNR